MVEREGLYYLENVSQQTYKGKLACLANEHIHNKTKRKYDYGKEDWDIPLLVI